MARFRIPTSLIFGYLVLLGAMLSPMRASAALVCAEVFKNSQLTPKQSQHIKIIVDWLRQISDSATNGMNTPTESNFRRLEGAIQEATLLNRELLALDQNSKERIAGELEQALAGDEYARRLFAPPPIHNKSYFYGPTEYDLKLRFQFLLSKLNRELPKSSRIPLARLYRDKRRETLNAEARGYVANLEDDFKYRFENSGYGSYADYEKMLRSSSDRAIQKALEIVDNDSLQPVIWLKEEMRYWIPKSGFQNQFVTGRSSGWLNFKKRENAEAAMYGQETSESYSKHDAEFKPKYGTLIVPASSGLKSLFAFKGQYGDDGYVLRKNRVRERLTFYPTDSLSQGPNVNSPNWLRSFIPWSYRLLIVPMMAKDLAKGYFHSAQSTELLPHIPTSTYWETQILGRITLDDVEEFHFRRRPTGAFLQELQKRKIRLIDESKSIAVEWVP